ncbi:hypothetical protein N7462_005534 [Penicillium macrosclerotiorum]|uniref:uncharacterized protein n=1 Tax=Penicillium macrosclerotiorum TaxID=303699 RepID=UPI0025471AA2|nr:uncharacterized protein N7462_005534 [Penicillium macrosclerotiorum]KAJ5682369.1 hypothetical protein N7462_005534 [Penicillium macrosclerotiorum]
MSSRILGSQPVSLLGPIPPTVDLTSQEYHHYPSKPAKTTGSCWTAPFRDGLPTPPGDMTGVAYNAVPTVAYGGKGHGMSSHLYDHSRAHFDSMSSSMMASLKSTQSHSNHAAPTKETSTTEPVNNQKKSAGTSSGSQLRIPSSINSSKGSLAEFAAQMTCLFWFEKTPKLQSIEDRRHDVPCLVAEAFPTYGFQKWVAAILSTTQVSQNVILLALLFIYRLKKFNAGVKGKKGSEFRLMTVALMLGNKFLDDNTYTNKTWAEVSGIAVQEIHIMEVEFLSNIRYDLFASEATWSRWQTKLGLFGDYFSQALKNPTELDKPALRISPPRLQQPQSPSSKLPSPPTDIFRPHSQPQHQKHWFMPGTGLPYPVPSQSNEVATGGSRKRSRDEDGELHPTKRVAMAPHNIPSALTISSAMNSGIPTLPPVLTPTSAPVAQTQLSGVVSRLPPPHLPPSSNPISHPLPPTTVSQLPVPALMPSVYNRNSNWTQQMPPAAVPPVASGVYNTPALSELARHNPSPFAVSSATVSPAVSAYSVHTPQTHLSPSYFLANRDSPYRPVRSVHTLLIPPPSTSMQQQRSVPFDHMHYQPLGKTSADRKTGLLPYIYPESWTQTPFQPFFPQTQNFSG